jgi:hypothetical protein
MNWFGEILEAEQAILIAKYNRYVRNRHTSILFIIIREPEKE